MDLEFFLDELKRSVEKEQVNEYMRKTFIEPFGEDADEVFLGLLRDARDEGNKNKILVPERYAVFLEVLELFKKIADKDSIKHDFCKWNNSGGIQAVFNKGALFENESLDVLREILQKSSNFSVGPMLRDRIDLSITIKGLFKEKE